MSQPQQQTQTQTQTPINVTNRKKIIEEIEFLREEWRVQHRPQAVCTLSPKTTAKISRHRHRYYKDVISLKPKWLTNDPIIYNKFYLTEDTKINIINGRVFDEYNLDCAIEKFQATTKVINQRMQKEIEVCECDLHGYGRICPIKKRYEKNAYQRKRKFEKKWAIKLK